MTLITATMTDEVVYFVNWFVFGHLNMAEKITYAYWQGYGSYVLDFCDVNQIEMMSMSPMPYCQFTLFKRNRWIF
mgnify:CR=1 FL=1